MNKKQLYIYTFLLLCLNTAIAICIWNIVFLMRRFYESTKINRPLRIFTEMALYDNWLLYMFLMIPLCLFLFFKDKKVSLNLMHYIFVYLCIEVLIITLFIFGLIEQLMFF